MQEHTHTHSHSHTQAHINTHTRTHTHAHAFAYAHTQARAQAHTHSHVQTHTKSVGRDWIDLCCFLLCTGCQALDGPPAASSARCMLPTYYTMPYMTRRNRTRHDTSLRRILYLESRALPHLRRKRGSGGALVPALPCATRCPEFQPGDVCASFHPPNLSKPQKAT